MGKDRRILLYSLIQKKIETIPMGGFSSLEDREEDEIDIVSKIQCQN